MEEGLLCAMLERRYEDITVSDLCARMGVPRKSFYRYFDSKEDALHALVDHALLDYEGYVPAGQTAVAPSFEKELERYFIYWQSKRPLLDALARSGLSTVLMERSLAQAQRDLPSLQVFMPCASEEEQEQIMMFATGGMMTLMIRWHHMGCRIAPEHMAHTAAQLLSRPLFEG